MCRIKVLVALSAHRLIVGGVCANRELVTTVVGRPDFVRVLVIVCPVLRAVSTTDTRIQRGCASLILDALVHAAICHVVAGPPAVRRTVRRSVQLDALIVHLAQGLGVMRPGTAVQRTQPWGFWLGKRAACAPPAPVMGVAPTPSVMEPGAAVNRAVAAHGHREAPTPIPIARAVARFCESSWT